MKPIFVFGSNLAGRHGKGAALCALKEHGAVYGNGKGLQGSSYAIPTKDENLNPLSLVQIKGYVLEFLLFGFNKWNHGTVVAGYRHHDGCVSYVLDDYPLSKANEKGPWGCGYAVPGILKDIELQYFKENPEAYAIWCASSDRVYNGERAPLIEMQAALLSMN